ncbi:hypothetical protein E8E15_005744 [Penicillium rubens]|uniref:Pc12g03260 protein n=2 Tax=Penicillium chrysogenum species complex TaxID=254878 RepID=B6H0V5_PENRW|nr:uncharacterized protein N7525_002142 [Penicillium rubens]KZN84658.1 hypothetical protein EN45_087990 [Penicillium chrysogenum]CAP79953.1 Pc12g03260 [Penicillium rubens Wisconsin 54-1255]KAF3019964.1 hypothetical protein E8E15_005744 [Penicillium rubens]KAJ5033938.1 hypothetical protein NUH16_005356 [Penicillium rubens]KAJ5844401.1 hypothetical protein N7525_002142 [Penicillium rubens]
MHFSKSVLAVTASLVSLGLAADPLSFTSWPKEPLEPGKPVTLTWTGATPDEPVTILLRQGNAGNLQDVKPITGQAKGGTFTWTPDDSVKKADTYAFQIKQKDQTNYTALLKGGSNPAAALPEAKDITSESGAAATTAATTGTTTDATTGTTGSTTAPNTQTTGGTTESTQGTQTTMTSTASKALISSAASPSGSPSSSAAPSSTDSLRATGTEIVHGKEASSTESAQTGGASIPQYSVQLVMGIVGLLAYLV